VTTRLAAHRGGAALWPENSLRAFREALALGVDLVEFDVHLAADGVPVVIHDATLDRTTEATGPVGARPAAELARVRLRGPDGAVTDERLPTLDALLALLAPSRAGLLVEVKGPVPGVNVAYRVVGDAVSIEPGPEYPGIVDTTVAALRAAGVLARANLMGFSPDVARRARELAPDTPATLLVSFAHVVLVQARPEDAIAWARRVGATDAGLQHTLVNAEVMAAARRAGVRVGVWTVNEEAEMRRLAALGVDVLTSDRPDVALRALGR
jgi:glycerophosphoryl diester phosphodiesterase